MRLFLNKFGLYLRMAWFHENPGKMNDFLYVVIDSWGKIPEGILSGHVNSLGDFDECVDTVVRNMNVTNKNYTDISTSLEGRYCNTFLSPYAPARFGHYWDTFPPPIPRPTTPPPRNGSGLDGRKAVSPKRLGVKFQKYLSQVFASHLDLIFVSLTSSIWSAWLTESRYFPHLEFASLIPAHNPISSKC